MAASATIKSKFFHPLHMLASYHYSERVVTGAGYSCDLCDFNIHKACFTMPGSVSFAQHSHEHELTLTRLTGSRWCDVCKETSHAGSYMYHCAPCNYDLHPRCVPTKTPMPAPNNNMGGGAGSSGNAVLTGLQAAGDVA
ncbi:unnamed protein product [Urochloa humidicola]